MQYLLNPQEVAGKRQRRVGRGQSWLHCQTCQPAEPSQHKGGSILRLSYSPFSCMISYFSAGARKKCYLSDSQFLPRTPPKAIELHATSHTGQRTKANSCPKVLSIYHGPSVQPTVYKESSTHCTQETVPKVYITSNLQGLLHSQW